MLALPESGMAIDARDVCAILVATSADGDLIWREVAGRPLLAWSVAAFEASSSVARILLVIPDAQISRAKTLRERSGWEKLTAILPDGPRRRDSVEMALRAQPDGCALVATHDAARPLVSPGLIAAGVSLAHETGVAIPVEPVKETIKRVRDGVIVGAVPRERLRRAQTPQVFSLALLHIAYLRAAPDQDPPDEAALLLRVGLPLSCYDGDHQNLRVMSVGELPVVEELLRRRLG
jgi:2-C-methyl-D-erythritol 4-phosphate cytidylyltransferase